MAVARSRARRRPGSARAARAPSLSPPGGGSPPPARGRATRATGCCPCVEPGGSARQRARGAQHLPARLLQPRPVERREHRVRPARLRAHRADVVDGRDARDARGASTPSPRAPARARSPRARANGLTSALKCSSPRADLAPPARQLALRRAVADHEPAAALAQRARRGRARHSSRNCVRGPEAWRPCRSRSSRQNTGTTRSWRVERGAQRGVVVHAQVAPVARRSRSPRAAARPRSAATASRRWSKIRSRSRRTKSACASAPSGPSGSA